MVCAPGVRVVSFYNQSNIDGLSDGPREVIEILQTERGLTLVDRHTLEEARVSWAEWSKVERKTENMMASTVMRGMTESHGKKETTAVAEAVALVAEAMLPRSYTEERTMSDETEVKEPKAKKVKVKKEKTAKAKKTKAPKAKKEPKERKETASSYLRELIGAGGLTDDQIFKKAQQKFGLKDDKRWYVSWYRNDMKKKGMKVAAVKEAKK